MIGLAGMEKDMETELLASAIDTLPEQPPVDVVLDHLGKIDCIKKFIKEYEPKLKAFLVAEIERTWWTSRSIRAAGSSGR